MLKQFSIVKEFARHCVYFLIKISTNDKIFWQLSPVSVTEIQLIFWHARRLLLHWDAVMHLSITELSHHWFRQWLIICLALPNIGHCLTWWRHQMETFSTLLAICAGNSPVRVEFPPQRPVTRSFDVFFDLCLNKLFIKQSWGWWFAMPSCPLWHHCNGPLPNQECCVRSKYQDK